MWECEWRRAVNADPAIKTFLRAFYRRAYGDTRAGLTLERALEAVRKRELFGFVECDVRVPDHLTAKFSEMPPIFKNVELSRDDLSEHMRDFAEREGHLPRPQRMLIGSMRGDRVLVFTELLAWYLEHGLVVDRIYQIVEYEAGAVYRDFADSVTEARRAGDVDSSQELKATAAKMAGNSAFGQQLKDKTRHKNVSYDIDDRRASGRVRSQFFHSINPLNEGVYETTTFKRTVSQPATAIPHPNGR
jgi:hypothetical protein